MPTTVNKVKKSPAKKPSRGLVGDASFKAMCDGLKAQCEDMSRVEIGQTIYDGLCEANGKPVKSREVLEVAVKTEDLTELSV